MAVLKQATLGAVLWQQKQGITTWGFVWGRLDVVPLNCPQLMCQTIVVVAVIVPVVVFVLITAR